MTGSIVRKRDNGYGFIKPDDGGKDVFFHAQSLVEVACDACDSPPELKDCPECGPKGLHSTLNTNLQKKNCTDCIPQDDSLPKDLNQNKFLPYQLSNPAINFKLD